ncbi:MAG: nucleoside hydrolase [Chloroflexota bacterium]|nr:nucleoside hydrolase [Chloroflexota bacterium]
MTDGTIPVILDVDPGVDDAVALAAALGEPSLSIEAITTLAGNVGVEMTTANTLAILDWLGAPEIPVHRGASRPLIRTPHDATYFHGSDGLGESGFAVSTRALAADRGPAAIVRHAMARPGQITLVCLGPLTNLAIALNVVPWLPDLLRSVVVMGGAFERGGNVTPFAEFNVFADPEAAAQVFGAPFPDITVVGLDVTERVAIDRPGWERLRDSRGGAAELVYRMARRSFAERGVEVFALHDPLAVAVAARPDLVTTTGGRVDVALGEAERGKTTLRVGGETKVALEVNVTAFGEWFQAALGLDDTVTRAAPV